MTEVILGFTQVIETLCQCTVSNLGRDLAHNLKPSSDPRRVKALQEETCQARTLLDRGGHVPLHGLADIRETIQRIELGAVLKPGELLQLGDLLRGCRRTRHYLQAKAEIAPLLAGYASSLTALTDLEEIIDLCIEGSRVSDQASQGLKKVRTQIAGIEQKIEQRLHSIISGSSNYLQDSFISQRDGRWVIPVQAVYRGKVPGTVISTSGTGSTVFIEPEAVRKLCSELAVLKVREENEEYQVLAMLTGEAAACLPAIKVNLQVMAALDLILARGKFSRAIDGRSVEISSGAIRLVEALHPLLPRDQAVPLNLELNPPVTTLVITGPNTGGKTVTLKTVGLLAMMHQSGLHIPAGGDSTMPVFDCILADIGDGQDISQSLSTFSAHAKNLVAILKQAGPRSLVLLDEIGTGTDPMEGAALAASVLEELYNRGATTLASTHYSDIKRLGEAHPGFINGAMDFDRDTLQPRYRLLLGQGGQSNGLWIAQTLGIPKHILDRARSYIGTRAEIQGLDLSFPSGPFPAVQPVSKKSAKPSPAAQFRVGDRVYIPSRNCHGVVSTPANHRNQLEVKVRDEIISIDMRRVKLHIPREELYPGVDYDLDIVLLSKEDRKLKHDMSRKLVPGQARLLQGNTQDNPSQD